MAFGSGSEIFIFGSGSVFAPDNEIRSEFWSSRFPGFRFGLKLLVLFEVLAVFEVLVSAIFFLVQVLLFGSGFAFWFRFWSWF